MRRFMISSSCRWVGSALLGVLRKLRAVDRQVLQRDADLLHRRVDVEGRHRRVRCVAAGGRAAASEEQFTVGSGSGCAVS